jgi:hypothetical protein
MSDTDIKDVVKETYGQAALRVKSGGSACCGVTSASVTSDLYNSSQAGRAVYICNLRTMESHSAAWRGGGPGTTDRR